MKGVFLLLRRLMDSMVCCSMPCIMSTTRMAMSQRLDPRDLRFVNDSCPAQQIPSKSSTSSLHDNFNARPMQLPIELGLSGAFCDGNVYT